MSHARFERVPRHVFIKAKRSRVVAIISAFALTIVSGCRPLPAVTDQQQQPAKENPAMTTTRVSDAPATGSSPITAKQALERFLDLIRTTKSSQDVTLEQLQKAMGVPITAEQPDHYGYGQALPGNWAFSVERLPAGSTHSTLNLSFDPLPGKDASSQAICDPDFAQFTGALEHTGFARHSSYGEHNRWLFDYFERPGMRVDVYPITSQSDAGEPAGPRCVNRVLVR